MTTEQAITVYLALRDAFQRETSTVIWAQMSEALYIMRAAIEKAGGVIPVGEPA